MAGLRVSVALTKYYGQKASCGERVCLACISTLLFIIEGRKDRNLNRAGTWRQDQMKQSYRGAAY